jgi:hypothetical protein
LSISAAKTPCHGGRSLTTSTSTVVSSGLSERFESENDEPLKVIINQDYTARIDELRDEAADDTSDYGSSAFRFLQILENLK